MQSWSEQILLKVGKIRLIFIFFFALLFFRLAYLLLFMHPYHVVKAEKLPLRKEATPVARGQIEDRNGQLLASNQAAPALFFLFKPVQKFPTFVIQNESTGTDLPIKKRTYPRREYINKISEYLAEEILVDKGIEDEQEKLLLAQKLRDFIYSKAALSPELAHRIPVTISRSLYIKLKAQMHLWPGMLLKMEMKRQFTRQYQEAEVQGGPCIAPHILGYIGKMDPVSFRCNEDRLRGLKAQLLLETDSLQRLAIEEEIKHLEGMMYRITDHVGQAGIERLYEKWLRGIYGQSLLSVNAKGEKTKKAQVIHKPKPPQSIRLTIDASLQLYCQKMLASLQPELVDKEGALNLPWVKPASILVMQPSSGKVLAMASYPDFDGNLLNSDYGLNEKERFLKSRFLGDSFYIKAVWDGKAPLKQIRYSDEYAPLENLHWPLWSDSVALIAGKGSSVIEWFGRNQNLMDLLEIYSSYLFLQRYLGEEFTAQEILDFACQESCREIDEIPTYERGEQILLRLKAFEEALGFDVHLKRLHSSLCSLRYSTDRVLIIDLCALLFDEDAAALPAQSPSQIYSLSVQEYRDDTQAHFFSSQRCKELALHLFERDLFSQWRKKGQDLFIKQKRKEERQKRQGARPYMNYLQKECGEQFACFWNRYGQEVVWGVLHGAAVSEEVASMVEEVKELFWEGEQGVFDAASRPERSGLNDENTEHLRTLVGAYQRRVRDWSFDQILSYERMMRSSDSLKNPLRTKYSRLYVGQRGATEMDLIALVTQSGYEPLSCTKNRAFQEAIVPGSIFKLAPAYEALCQKYKKGARTRSSLNPLTFYDQHFRDAKGVFFVGVDEDNRRIPQYFEGGRIPKSLSSHIGEVDLLAALQYSSNPYFALLAARVLERGGEDLCRSARELGYGEKTGFALEGETRGFIPLNYKGSNSSLYSASIGQDCFLATPLQTACMLSAIANGGYLLKPQIIDSWSEQGKRYKKCLEIRREVFMPQEVRSYLLEGMRRVATGKKGVLRLPQATPAKEVHMLQSLAPYVVGKTSTAEVDLVGGVSPSAKRTRENHIWFGAISFKEPLFDPADTGSEISVEDFSEKSPELVVIAVLKQGYVGRDLSTACYKVISHYKKHCSR